MPLSSPSRRSRLLLAVCALILTALWLAGCRTVTTPQSSSAMNVLIQVKDYRQGSTQVGVHFATQQGDTIEFVSGETVACNDTFLKYDSNPIERLISYGSYVGEVSDVGANGKYTFAYTPAQGGDRISIPVQVVNAPVHVTSPTSGASVPLPGNDPLVIHYDSSSLDHTTILAVLNDSRGKYTVTLPTRETGALTVKHDQTQDFQPGPGLISLARVTTRTVSGTGFHQVTVEYDNITAVPVIWQ